MKPISRFRTRARSDARSSATGRPFSSYDPCVGESRRPRIESKVDLPQPDGPAIDTYSPRSICTLTFDSACVSTSSVENTLVRSCSLMTGGAPFGLIVPAPLEDERDSLPYVLLECNRLPAEPGPGLKGHRYIRHLV